MKKKLEPFKTTDITFAASLICLGKKLEGSDEIDRGQLEFSFKDDDEIMDLMNDYVSGDLLVDPNKLQSNIRTLKGLISKGRKY